MLKKSAGGGRFPVTPNPYAGGWHNMDPPPKGFIESVVTDAGYCFQTPSQARLPAHVDGGTAAVLY